MCPSWPIRSPEPRQCLGGGVFPRVVFRPWGQQACVWSFPVWRDETCQPPSLSSPTWWVSEQEVCFRCASNDGILVFSGFQCEERTASHLHLHTRQGPQGLCGQLCTYALWANMYPLHTYLYFYLYTVWYLFQNWEVAISCWLIALSHFHLPVHTNFNTCYTGLHSFHIDLCSFTLTCTH